MGCVGCRGCVAGFRHDERADPRYSHRESKNEKTTMTNDNDANGSERGKYGDTRILVDELDNSYQQVGDDLKAKVWESDEGERRLYLRVRDSDDGRKFNEFSVEISRSLHADTEP